MYIHTKTCMQVFRGFIHDRQKVKTSPMSFIWWTDKLWHIRTMKYCSAIKRSKRLIHTTWMNITRICERSQSQRATYCTIPFMWHSWKGKIIGTEDKSVVSRAWVKGATDYKGAAQVDFWVINLFCTMTVGVDTWFYASVQTQRTIYHKEWISL